MRRLALFAVAVTALAAPVRAAGGDDAARAQKLQRWQALPAAERTRLLERYQQWQALPEAERTRLKSNLERLRALGPDEVRGLRKAQERLRTLPAPARDVMLARVKEFRRLPARQQLEAIEHAEVLAAVPPGERERLRRLPPAERGREFRAHVERFRQDKMLRRLTPEEQRAVAGVPTDEQRGKIRELVAARREAQMRRLSDGERRVLAAMPPGPERERGFAQALERVNELERAAHGLLAPPERRALAAMDPAARAERLRTMLPDLRRRAIERLPEAERTRIGALPPGEQEVALRAYRDQRLLERLDAMLRPEQATFVRGLPAPQRLDWCRELVEGNREAFLATLPETEQATYRELKPRERDERLEKWLRDSAIPAGVRPESR